MLTDRSIRNSCILLNQIKEAMCVNGCYFDMCVSKCYFDMEAFHLTKNQAI